MESPNYHQLNRRFDFRYGNLLSAGAKLHSITDCNSYPKIEIAGLYLKSLFNSYFIANTEIMYKPFESFDSTIQNIIKE